MIDPRKGLSCSLLVRRTKSLLDSSVTSDETSSNTGEFHESPQRSYSWSNVPLSENSTSWDAEFGCLPPVPFARHPVKMRQIPSVSSTAYVNSVTVYKGGNRISPNVFSRKRAEILNQRDSQIGRSYQILRELSDVSKLSENGKGALREKVIRERTHILSLYNEDLRKKIKDFHKKMDTFIVENGATPTTFTQQRTFPKIY